MAEMIDSFQGEYRFLSNFEPATVELDGEVYPSVEHAYQAAKTEDLEERAKIQGAPTPGKAKRLGRRVRLRANWDAMRVEIMADLVSQKFHDSELERKLLDTGTRQLVEGNSWNDKFWGVCNGFGKNHLGRILMAIRRGILRAKNELEGGA